MTVVLSATSRRKPFAIAFGKELARAMRERYVSKAAVADGCDLAYSVVQHYIKGYSLPKLSTATRIADSLSWPRLADIAREGRTMQCRTCGGDFIDEGTQKAYCSNLCMVIDQKKHRGMDGRKRASMAEDVSRRAMTELSAFKIAINGMCTSCEPDGVCRTPDCPLRNVSPLPLLAGREAPLIPAGRRRITPKEAT